MRYSGSALIGLDTLGHAHLIKQALNQCLHDHWTKLRLAEKPPVCEFKTGVIDLGGKLAVTASLITDDSPIKI